MKRCQTLARLPGFWGKPLPHLQFSRILGESLRADITPGDYTDKYGWVKKMKTICFIILLLPLICEGAPEHLREQKAIEDLGASRMYGDWVDVESRAKGGHAEEPLKPGQRIVELSLNSRRELRDEQLKALESLPHLIHLRLDHSRTTNQLPAPSRISIVATNLNPKRRDAPGSGCVDFYVLQRV